MPTAVLFCFAGRGAGESELRQMLGGRDLLDWLLTTGTLSLSVAWIFALLWVLLRGPLLAKRNPDDALTFAAVFGAALALRLAIPWGPLDFAEASRLEPVWNQRIEPLGDFIALPFLLGALRGLGVATTPFVRALGPAFGALAVGLTYLLARNAGLGKPASFLGACVLLVLPAHVRYSASGVLTVPGPAIWTGVFALALAKNEPALSKIPMLAASIIIGVYARPEYRLLGLAVLPLLLLPSYAARSRAALFALLGVGFIPYLTHLGTGHEHAKMDGMWNTFLGWIFTDPWMNPWWWLVFGAVGLAAGKLPLQVKACLAIATAALLVTYRVMGLEYNPLFGEWRYAVSVTSFLCVGIAALADRLALGRKAPARDLWFASAAALVLGALGLRAITRPIDIQAEAAYLREKAPELVSGVENIVLVMRTEQEAAQSIPTEATAALSIAMALSPPLNTPYSCDKNPVTRPPRLWTQEALLAGCIRGATADNTLVFMGLYRPESSVAALEERFELSALDERTVTVAPATQHMNTQCVIRDGELLGSSLADCDVRLGFYRPIAKAPAP